MTKHGTILLVEEDADDIVVTKKALTDAGVSNPIHTVHSGEEAIKYFSGRGKFANRQTYPLPFLVLLNLKMPGEDGFATFRWLFERPGLRKKFTVVALTSASPDSEIQLAYELGAHSCLLKPLEFSQLVATAQRVKEYWIELNLPPEAAA